MLWEKEEEERTGRKGDGRTEYSWCTDYARGIEALMCEALNWPPWVILISTSFIFCPRNTSKIYSCSLDQQRVTTMLGILAMCWPRITHYWAPLFKITSVFRATQSAKRVMRQRKARHVTTAQRRVCIVCLQTLLECSSKPSFSLDFLFCLKLTQ